MLRDKATLCIYAFDSNTVGPVRVSRLKEDPPDGR